MRRPSFATAIALIALFVALGGPAQAARLITGAEIKDRSVKTRDLSRPTVRTLRTPLPGSVTAARLAPGAVGSRALSDGSVGMADLGANAVGGAQIADGAVGAMDLGANSVGASEVADGSLDARDIGRFFGRFRVTVPSVPAGSCWAAEPTGLAPERAGADISQDLVLVTPDAGWPSDRLAFTVKNSGDRRRFVLSGCNRSVVTAPSFEVGFRYLVIRLP